MNIEINDYDLLTDDKDGRSRCVLYTNDQIDLAFATVLEAKIFISSAGKSFPCEVYQPRPNGHLDLPHLHMRADGQFCLNEIIAVGDIITVM
ncbi:MULTISPECIES: hypothetical protein [unclassified Leisingera]|uniref:hypothetical protein n=1 Tax=unclassified Leisingera TaxID=2614906 RepID=UPI001010BD02|nr:MULTISPECIES: hypothetical protein [unclassified Leisingera]MCF6429989.1 hypothetical protein [Leisingera sp. MMG026]QAX31971.1 hypothetical protein ETW24_21525 [Leisingera sp. NJS204]